MNPHDRNQPAGECRDEEVEQVFTDLIEAYRRQQQIGSRPGSPDYNLMRIACDLVEMLGRRPSLMDRVGDDLVRQLRENFSSALQSREVELLRGASVTSNRRLKYLKAGRIRLIPKAEAS